ncbi:MAG: GtrA family protein, partial [Planctomycetales bacterium]|nr:GtrA family protein [Planctomycetales bacterium]
MSTDGLPALPRRATTTWPAYGDRSLRTQALRFLFVGGSSVAIDLAVYMALVGTLQPLSAKAISYIAGMLFGFVGNKFWTFESRRKSVSEPLVYTVLYAVTLAVNVGLNSLCLALLAGIQTPEPLARFLAFLLATGTTTVLNFVGLKYFA